MKISGKLIGKDSAHVRSAKVQIHDSGGTISEAVSNENGIFECPVVDSYADLPLKLVVSAAGYKPFEKEIQCNGDTDLHDLELSAVPVTAPPAPVASRPWPWLPIVGGIILLLGLVLGVRSCLHPWQIPDKYVGTWTETTPSPMGPDGHIVTLLIPTDPRADVTVTYKAQYHGPIRFLRFVTKNERVTTTKSRGGSPSFRWSYESAGEATKELQFIDGKTLRLVTTTPAGISPQIFTKL